jgi:UDP-glucose 4-epimerase
MHFAGFAYVGESVTDPAKYYDNNVVGSLSLLSAMQACEIDFLVFSSSCATYGIPSHQPINESIPQLPINPYGMTKLIIERALADYDVAYGLRSVRLRYFNAGCGQYGFATSMLPGQIRLARSAKITILRRTSSHALSWLRREKSLNSRYSGLITRPPTGRVYETTYTFPIWPWVMCKRSITC